MNASGPVPYGTGLFLLQELVAKYLKRSCSGRMRPPESVCGLRLRGRFLFHVPARGSRRRNFVANDGIGVL